MNYYSCCGSHIGRVRGNNEDNLNQNGWVPSDHDLEEGFVRTVKTKDAFSACVCDGMGGESYGERASRLAAETFSSFLKIDSEEKLREFTDKSNRGVCKMMVEQNARIGTTFAGVYLSGSCAYISNVGDSKIFRIADGRIEQLSVDHTELQVMIENKVITTEQAESGRFRNCLTQNLGIFEDEMILEPSFSCCAENVGDRFLICSDGLTDMLKKDEILSVVLKNSDLERAVVELVKAALSRGGKDNITVVLMLCTD